MSGISNASAAMIIVDQGLKIKTLQEENKKLREVVKDLYETLSESIDHIEGGNAFDYANMSLRVHEQFLKGLE